MPKPKVRKGMPSVQLTKEEFSKRARERFYDPTFDAVAPEIERVIAVAWKNYTEYHRNPRKRRAGRGFSDPEFPLPIEWLETRKAIQQAEKRQNSPKSNSRILLINGSTRSNQTCPGEMSKTFRLAKIAEKVHLREQRFRSGLSGSQPARVGVWPDHLSVQGLRLDSDAIVQLALLLLSEPCHGTGQRLDGGNLPALGCGAWSDDPMPGPLVPGAQLIEADDRPFGLRRRRQSGPDFDERQESSTSQRSGT